MKGIGRFNRSPKIHLPTVKNTRWVRNGIDRFILARLEKEGMQPSPQADARTLDSSLVARFDGLVAATNRS